MQNKKILAIIIAVILVIIALVVGVIVNLNNNKEENNKKEEKIVNNTNEEVIQDSAYNDLEINNIRLEVQGDLSVFYADVVNNTNEIKNIEDFGILLLDKDGNEVVTLLAYLGEPLNPGESREIISSVDLPLTNDEVASAEYVEYVEE